MFNGVKMPAPKSKLAKGGRKDLTVKETGRSWNMATLYESTFPKEVVKMMSKGHSIYEVALHLGVGTRTMYNWAEQFPEFKAALEDGKDYRRAWLDKGFHTYMDEKFDIKGYTVALTADYNYNDKGAQINIDMSKSDEESIKTVTDIIQDLHKNTI